MGSLVSLIRKFDAAEHVRGRQFEMLCKWFLENDPEYKSLLKKVWLWRDWPRRWSIEKGVDLIAETYDGEFWAIQSKAYGPDKSVTQRDVDSFLSDSSRKLISYRLLLTTAGRVGRNAEELINAQGLRSQNSPIGYLCLGDLRKRDLSWPESFERLEVRQQPKKELRKDQRKAVDEALAGLELHTRGQIIRACGTGKTLIGLHLFERLNAQTALVFAPTLSLISQLIRDWKRNAHTPFRFRPICSDETDLRRGWEGLTTAQRDERTAAIPLANGETATITMPKKMTPQSWQMLIDTLELWKKQASETEEKSAG